MRNFRRTIKVDLHGLLKVEAEYELQRALDNLPPNIDTVEVIHGIGSGALKQMVAEFYHHKIYDRAQCIGNPGQTNYYVRKS